MVEQIIPYPARSAMWFADDGGRDAWSVSCQMFKRV